MTALRNERLRNGITGPEVSRLTGISTTNLYRYENKSRKLPVPVAKKLASLYKTRWEIFYEEDPEGTAQKGGQTDGASA